MADADLESNALLLHQTAATDGAGVSRAVVYLSVGLFGPVTEMPGLSVARRPARRRRSRPQLRRSADYGAAIRYCESRSRARESRIVNPSGAQSREIAPPSCPSIADRINMLPKPSTLT